MQIWDGGPFIYPGMNSIAIYVLSDILCNAQVRGAFKVYTRM